MVVIVSYIEWKWATALVCKPLTVLYLEIRSNVKWSCGKNIIYRSLFWKMVLGMSRCEHIDHLVVAIMFSQAGDVY